jgi:hypothetical protein
MLHPDATNDRTKTKLYAAATDPVARKTGAAATVSPNKWSMYVSVNDSGWKIGGSNSRQGSRVRAFQSHPRRNAWRCGSKRAWLHATEVRNCAASGHVKGSAASKYAGATRWRA